jgi:putative transposase
MEQAIWQRRFWEHRIRDERDFARHVDYNPVKHGYVQHPADWPHSSIHRYIRQGILIADGARLRSLSKTISVGNKVTG